MRIAMLGTRGVPASYSGFETCVESVGRRLADRGHQIVVYCRSGHFHDRRNSYLGMELRNLPSIRTKGLDTLSHSALSAVDAMVHTKPHVAMWFGVGNAIFCTPFKAVGIPTAINVDGADWARKKWGLFGRNFLRLSETLSVRTADALIADSRTIVNYYQRRFKAASTYIPYGADVPKAPGTAALRQFGLNPRSYLLAVGRMVPENGFHDLLAAYTAARSSMPFVIIGDAPYSEDYKRRLRRMAPPGAIFTGYQFGTAYHELSAHAYAFLFGASVGGTHPVLVEQLTHGNCVISRWTESNAEVANGAALMFRDQASLEALLREVLRDPGKAAEMRGRALIRASNYSWDRVTDAYESLFDQLHSGNGMRLRAPS